MPAYSATSTVGRSLPRSSSRANRLLTSSTSVAETMLRTLRVAIDDQEQ